MSEITLKEYIDVAIRHEREQREMQFRDQENALNLTKADLERRLAGMNELRAQITSERGNFLTVVEFTRQHEGLVTQIRKMELDAAERSGQVKQSAVTAAVLASIVVGILVGGVTALIAHWVTK